MRRLSSVLAGRVRKVRASLQRLDEGGWVAVSQTIAREHHLHLGERFSLPTPTGAVRMLGQADDLTAAGVLLEMSAPSAAGLVIAMDADRAVKLLGQAAPVTVAAILRNVPADRRRLLLNRLSEPFRSLVVRHL